jgi:hypothetical protein
LLTQSSISSTNGEIPAVVSLKIADWVVLTGASHRRFQSGPQTIICLSPYSFSSILNIDSISVCDFNISPYIEIIFLSIFENAKALRGVIGADRYLQNFAKDCLNSLCGKRIGRNPGMSLDHSPQDLDNHPTGLSLDGHGLPHRPPKGL